MKENRGRQGEIERNSKGMGTLTKNTVRKRAEDLAFIKGRSRKRVNKNDFEEAEQELTGRRRLEPKSTPAEQLTEEDRWNPVPESKGRKDQPQSAPDEQTFSEKLVKEGVAEAEHDQMVRATRQSLRRDRR